MTTARHYTKLLLALCFFFGSSALAQEVKKEPYYPDRYQLDIPAEWLKKPRIVHVITDILPKTLTELGEKQFCTDCSAGMRVTLFIDSLKVSNEYVSAPIQLGRSSRYTFSFNYRFYAALMLSDSNNRPISWLRLNDAAELMHYSKSHSIESRYSNERRQPVLDTLGRIIDYRRIPEQPMVVTDLPLPARTASQVLTDEFILDICLRRIMEIDKFLRKSEE